MGGTLHGPVSQKDRTAAQLLSLDYAQLRALAQRNTKANGQGTH